jgi:MFS family permease
MTSALLALHARTFVSLRKHRNYQLFFTGQAVSASGTWMQDAALPWLIVQRTHSPVAVGLLLFCRYVPFTLFGLSAGVFADRFDNRRFLIGTQCASMCSAGVLATLTLTGIEPLGAIYVLAFLGGAALVFDSPSRHALTFQLVGRDELPNAVALNSSLFNAAQIVGPAMAGAVIAGVGVGVCFAINAASFLAVLAVLLLMRTAELFPLERGQSPLKGMAAIREGIDYVMREPRLKLVVAIAAVVSLLGFQFRVLLPVLASKTLTVGAGIFGVLFACFGAGALAGGLVAAGARRPSWGRLLVGVGGFSTAMLVLAPLRSVWAAAVLLFATGFGFALWSATSQTLLQLAAPDALRGRVLGVYFFALAGFTPLGSLLTGWLASVGGTELAFSVAGAAGLLATAVGIVRMRSLRSIAPRSQADPVVDLAEPPLAHLTGRR